MIKQLREKTGLTQTDAAKRLRINIGFWSRIESGHADLPPKRYKRVAKFLRVPMKKLMDIRLAKFKKELKSAAFGR